MTMSTKNMAEMTAYIESRIRAFGRDNGVLDRSSCISMYASMVGEKSEFIHRVIKAEERPTAAILRSLIGHMGITRAYEVESRASVCEKGYNHEEYYYVLRKRG